MTKTFKVAAAQVRPVLFDLNGSLNKVLLKIQEAATKNVKLIVSAVFTIGQVCLSVI